MNTDTYLIRRSRMVERLKSAGIRNETVLRAISRVPRHLFIEDIFENHAYDDLSLPLPAGQTISQPYIVARMSELLCSPTIGFPQKVLEIGTGCGYQTAVLDSIGIGSIYSIERIKKLHDIARYNLQNSGFYRARLIYADGYAGLPSFAPFDGIIITAAPPQIPVPLLQQLATGGRMVLPLGDEQQQFLYLIEKTEQGYRETCLERVNFVPMLDGKIQVNGRSK